MVMDNDVDRKKEIVRLFTVGNFAVHCNKVKFK